MKRVSQGKKLGLLALAAVLLLGAALATTAFAATGQASQTGTPAIAVNAPAFPAKGTVTARTPLRPAASTKGKALATLAKGTQVTALDYTTVNGKGYFAVEHDGQTGYVDGDKLTATFSCPLEGTAIKKGWTFKSKSTAKKQRATELYAGSTMTLLAREGKWWKADLYGETVYVQASIVREVSFGLRYDEAGKFENKEVKVVKDNVLITTGDVTLSNMVIEGDLYLAASIDGGEVTLKDVHVVGRMRIHGNVQLVEQTGKMDKVGSASEIASDIFREHFGHPDEDVLTTTITGLAECISKAVYAD